MVRVVSRIKWMLREGPPAAVVVLCDRDTAVTKFCLINCRFGKNGSQAIRRALAHCTSLDEAESQIAEVAKRLPARQIGCYRTSEAEIQKLVEAMSEELGDAASSINKWRI